MSDKTDFMAQAKAQMMAWSDEITKMQGQMMQAGKDAQDQMIKQMEALNAQRKHAEAQMEELGKANMEAAKEIQANLEKAWADMEKQISEARKNMMG